ncbi:MAG: hypothetical protein A4E73_00275 [Syntrophaceae bacterium PtaU1.Bin231]|nr:MAG: hypothetical protein A4E73_00275 [Syntrophaceae bacterium PtaU1.Bin231]
MMRKAANIMKKMIWFTLMLRSSPIMPSVPTTVCTTTLSTENPGWAIMSGRYGPTKQYRSMQRAMITIGMPTDRLVISRTMTMARMPIAIPSFVG